MKKHAKPNSRVLQAGQRFEKLTVKEYDPNTKSYICICDCGKETRARSWALKTGRHKGCKCRIKEIRAEKRLPDNLGIKRSILRNYKRAAKARGYEFLLTDEEFFYLILNNCHYCNSEPNMIHSMRPHYHEMKYNGVDRINNSIGYTKQNCVTACKICNNSKSTLTTQEWFDWIRTVSIRLEKITTSTLMQKIN